MPDLQQQTDRRQKRVQRIAREALRDARAQDGWQAYEAAKGYVRRKYGSNVPSYDAIMTEITDQLEI